MDTGRLVFDADAPLTSLIGAIAVIERESGGEVFVRRMYLKPAKTENEEPKCVVLIQVDY